MNDSPKRPATAANPSWPASRRRWVSALIVFHLAAVIYAPLTLDGALGDLLRRFGFLRTYATALYLDHGYRYFAPDPGPTHTIRFEHAAGQGEPSSVRLPDRNQTKPRLMYHRWFMLGESLATEVAGTLASFADYYANQQQLAADIDELQKLGRAREARQLIVIRQENERQFERRWEMTKILATAIKKHLMEQHPNETVRLFSRRQLIPRPYDVLSGKSALHPDFVQEIELTDPQAVMDAAQPEEVPPPGDQSK